MNYTTTGVQNDIVIEGDFASEIIKAPDKYIKILC